MPPKMSKILISPDGKTIQFIYNDETRGFLDEGQSTIFRASHVEPNVNNKWEADMTPVKGPILGPFDTREEALLAEVKWIQENILTGE
jgi:hypothetical protein